MVQSWELEQVLVVLKAQRERDVETDRDRDDMRAVLSFSVLCESVLLLVVKCNWDYVVRVTNKYDVKRESSGWRTWKICIKTFLSLSDV